MAFVEVQGFPEYIAICNNWGGGGGNDGGFEVEDDDGDGGGGGRGGSAAIVNCRNVRRQHPTTNKNMVFLRPNMIFFYRCRIYFSYLCRISLFLREL